MPKRCRSREACVGNTGKAPTWKNASPWCLKCHDAGIAKGEWIPRRQSRGVGAPPSRQAVSGWTETNAKLGGHKKSLLRYPRRVPLRLTGQVAKELIAKPFMVKLLSLPLGVPSAYRIFKLHKKYVRDPHTLATMSHPAAPNLLRLLDQLHNTGCVPQPRLCPACLRPCVSHSPCACGRCLLFVPTDVEHRTNALTQAGLVKISFKKGEIEVETLFEAGDKMDELTPHEKNEFGSALRAQASEGMLIVHHGGIERKLCLAYGVELHSVCDQLAVIRLLLGHTGPFSALTAGKKVPLGMEWLAKYILKELHDHTATGDAIRQGKVLICMLRAYLDFIFEDDFEAEAEDGDEDEDEDMDEDGMLAAARASARASAAPQPLYRASQPSQPPQPLIPTSASEDDWLISDEVLATLPDAPPPLATAAANDDKWLDWHLSDEALANLPTL